MRDLLDAMKAHVAALMDQRSQPRHAIVTSYDPVNGLAKVQYHPGDGESGWLPVSGHALGGGWGLVVGLQVGQQVFVLPDCGDAEHGVVVSATYSQQSLPPQVPSAPAGGSSAVQAGESALVHASGQVIRLCADGSIYSRGPWKHEGTLDVTGAVTATGNITAGKGGGDQVTLQTHDHTYNPGNQPPAATSSPVAGS